MGPIWTPYMGFEMVLLYMALYLELYMGTDFNRWINNNCHYFFKRSRGHGSPPTQSCIHPCRESILIGPLYLLGCPTKYLGQGVRKIVQTWFSFPFSSGAEPDSFVPFSVGGEVSAVSATDLFSAFSSFISTFAGVSPFWRLFFWFWVESSWNNP